MPLPVVELPAGSLLYRRSRSRSPRVRGPLVWFALWPGYGSAESYGAFVHTYRLWRSVRLLDLSPSRKTTLADLGVGFVSLDEQYSGAAPNARFHRDLLPALRRNRLDGTIVVDDEDARDHGVAVAGAGRGGAGPTEVALVEL